MTYERVTLTPTGAGTPPIYDSDWAARQIEAYGALRRKEIAVRAVCWLIVVPALPVFFTCIIADWIAERDAPRWCHRLADKAETFAAKYECHL